MDDAVEFVAILFFDRHHVAAISLGHDGFAEIGGLILVGHQLLEGLADAILDHFLFRADAGELRRRPVAHFAMLVKDAVDMVDELLLGDDESRDFLQSGIHQVPLPFEVVVHFFIGFQRRGQVDEFLGEEDHLLPRFAKDVSDIVGFAQGRGDFPLQKDGGFFRLLQLFLYDFRLIERLQGNRHFLGQLRRRQLAELISDLVKFQRL